MAGKLFKSGIRAKNQLTLASRKDFCNHFLPYNTGIIFLSYLYGISLRFHYLIRVTKRFKKQGMQKCIIKKSVLF